MDATVTTRLLTINRTCGPTKPTHQFGRLIMIHGNLPLRSLAASASAAAPSRRGTGPRARSGALAAAPRSLSRSLWRARQGAPGGPSPQPRGKRRWQCAARLASSHQKRVSQIQQHSIGPHYNLNVELDISERQGRHFDIVETPMEGNGRYLK